MSDPRLPYDAWLAMHNDSTVCLDWDCAGLSGGGITPMLRFSEREPQTPIECNGDGEDLRWVRVTVMPVNAAARGGGYARAIEEDDDD